MQKAWIKQCYSTPIYLVITCSDWHIQTCPCNQNEVYSIYKKNTVVEVVKSSTFPTFRVKLSVSEHLCSHHDEGSICVGLTEKKLCLFIYTHTHTQMCVLLHRCTPKFTYHCCVASVIQQLGVYICTYLLKLYIFDLKYHNPFWHWSTSVMCLPPFFLNLFCIWLDISLFQQGASLSVVSKTAHLLTWRYNKSLEIWDQGADLGSS